LRCNGRANTCPNSSCSNANRNIFRAAAGCVAVFPIRLTDQKSQLNRLCTHVHKPGHAHNVKIQPRREFRN
jgi:hypothetical protein